MKKRYILKYNPDYAEEITLAKQNIFDVGNEVGLLAQKLFPGGSDSSFDNYTKINESIDLTKKLIDEGKQIIYEAGFEFNYVRCFIDILVRGNNWEIYEVKSSTSVSETYINDATLQYYILSKCGLNISNIYIVHLNNKYVQNDNLRN